MVRLKCVTWASAAASSSSLPSFFVSSDAAIDGDAEGHPQCCRSQAAVRVIGAVVPEDAPSFSGLVGGEETEIEAARRCAAACRRRSFQCGLSNSKVLCSGSGGDDGSAADMCVRRLGRRIKRRRSQMPLQSYKSSAPSWTRRTLASGQQLCHTAGFIDAGQGSYFWA